MQNNLPNLVRDYLDRTGKSQRDLAKSAGLDEAVLSRLLNSSRPIVDLEKADMLRKIIGFKPSDLIIEIAIPEEIQAPKRKTVRGQ